MIKITKDWLKTKLAITQMHNIYDELISQPLFQNDSVWADEQQQQLQQQLLLHSIFTDWMLFLTPNQQC